MKNKEKNETTCDNFKSLRSLKICKKNRYFPKKRFVDPPPHCIKNVQKIVFPLLDNKINLIKIFF